MKYIETTGEDAPQIELPPSLPTEAHNPKYLRREYDASEHGFRRHVSLTRTALQGTFVSS